MEDIVTGETKEVHLVWMPSYADSSLVVGAEIREVFKITKHQEEFEISDEISVGKGPVRVGEYRVQIAWVGLEDEESTWETDDNYLRRRSQVPRAETMENTA